MSVPHWSFRGRVEPPVSGVYPRGQALPGGDVLQGHAQGVPLVGGQTGADVLLVGGADGVQLGHQLPALVGQVQRVQPPVGLVALPAHEPALFEGVDEVNEPARWHTQLGGHDLLATARLRGDGAEQAGLRRGEVKAGDPFGEPLRGVGADLGQQERDPAPAAPARRSGL